jgi:hypothetical protein
MSFLVEFPPKKRCRWWKHSWWYGNGFTYQRHSSEGADRRNCVRCGQVQIPAIGGWFPAILGPKWRDIEKVQGASK